MRFKAARKHHAAQSLNSRFGFVCDEANARVKCNALHGNIMGSYKVASLTHPIARIDIKVTIVEPEVCSARARILIKIRR
jgi:hypothetical protein